MPPGVTAATASVFARLKFATPTFSMAVFEVSPVPDWVEVIADVVLIFAPKVVPVTVTLNVQFAPATRVPPVTVIRFPPEITRLFAGPPQTVAFPLTAVNPAGN